jgi:hypothetical protein
VQTLVEKERRKTFRHKLVRLTAVLILVLTALPRLFNFYCRQIIGTNYETIVIRTFPLFTEKMVRAAVITDSWYMKASGPLLSRTSDREQIEFRRAVIELGLEKTGDGQRDTQKIRNLKDTVAATLAGLPDPRQKVIAFAVYELPPRKER